MPTIVQAGARLHLGFLDLNGGYGRRFGSIGVALEEPRCVVEAARAPAGGPSTDDGAVREIQSRLGSGLGAGAIAVRVIEAIPVHAGFGAGTQLALAVALAATREAGRPTSIRELARRLGRGQRSGIGIAVFEEGGLVIDAGHASLATASDSAGDAEGPEPPPVIFRHPLPRDWYFVLATPRAAPGLSGTTEQRAFESLCPMDAERVGRICRLALMKVAPAAITGDVRTFGAGITEIQEVIGEYFAPHQGGRFASPTGCEAVELALARGAHGVGQSSWGPTVFALVEGEAPARALVALLRERFGNRLAWVGASRVRNAGASCREAP